MFKFHLKYIIWFLRKIRPFKLFLNTQSHLLLYSVFLISGMFKAEFGYFRNVLNTGLS